MNKKGEIFLIATLIILSILIGLGAVYTSTKAPKEDIKVYDLTNEITYEASRVIDNGVFTGANIETNVKNLTDFYSKSNPDSNFAVVYGDKNSLKAVYYEQTSAGSIGIATGGGTTTQTIYQRTATEETLTLRGNKVVVEFGGNSYSFDVGEGQSFYLVIKKEREDEAFVATQ